MEFDTEDITPPELEGVTGVSVLPSKLATGAPSFTQPM
jgi:hypothetical protein